MKYTITYWIDAAHTQVASKVEETPLTIQQLMGHSHVISVVPFIEKKEDKQDDNNTRKNKS